MTGRLPLWVRGLMDEIKLMADISGADNDDALALMIRDAARAVLDYCRLKRLPPELGCVVRDFVAGYIKADSGQNIESVKRGDNHVVYRGGIDINGFSERQRSSMNRYRRIRMG